MRSSFELWEIMFYFLLDCQSANQNWHYGPEPALYSQPGRGWCQVDTAARSPALSCVVCRGRTHAWDAEYFIQGYPSPTFQQHSIHVKNWSKLILISVYMLLGNEFWMGQEVGCSDDHCLCWAPTTSTTVLSHPSISGRCLSLSHCFLFYFYLPL